MKKIFILWCLFISCFLFYMITKHLPKHIPTKLRESPIAVVTPKISLLPIQQRTFLFVPSWSLQDSLQSATYSGYIYFGIVPTSNGIDMSNISQAKIRKFLSFVPEQKEKLLAIQLLDQDTNERILHDLAYQKTIIAQSVQMAKQYGFSGIVLDFEYSALAFDSVMNTTSHFFVHFAQSVHTSNIAFYPALYGDVFYRIRPYDVALIGKQSDGIFIMAYDFHKSSGDPGQNFPFQKSSSDDYDFSDMIADFKHAVDVNKLIVVFGMFGYDWKVNAKGQSIASGVALSIHQVNQSIINNCVILHCQILRNSVTAEEQVRYQDDQQTMHTVWFEDERSAAFKSAYLMRNGIANIAFWANGYF